MQPVEQRIPHEEPPMKSASRCLLAVLVLFGIDSSLIARAPEHAKGRQGDGKLKVFILAGQSNMEGHGKVRLTDSVRARLQKEGQFDRDRHGYLDWLARESEAKSRYSHLLTDAGGWVERDDVWFRWERDDQVLRGPLRVGLGAGGDRDRIGPELQFGHVLGEHFDDPVLLVKTAWGGKSLAVDFRPPSAGLPAESVLEERLREINERHEKRGRPQLSMDELKESYGKYYRLLLEQVDEALGNLEKELPKYDAESGYEIAGIVWFQGWNDGGSDEYAEEYAANLVHLVGDLRREYGDVPVVIASSGFGKNAPSRSDGWVNRLRELVEPAQIAAAKQLENTTCFETGDCLVPHPDRTSNSGIHHWFGSAESYFLIGDGLGMAMVRLLEAGELGTHGYVQSGDVKIHYVTAGEGPLLVMIHGFPDYWYSWRHQMPTLAKSFQVVAIDQRGYNRSDQPEGVENYHIDKLVGDVRAVVRHFEHDEAVVVGHDWGGMVAWSFAMQHPEMCERLIVLNLPHPNGLRRELANNPEQQKNSQYAREFQKPDAAKKLRAEGLAFWVQDSEARKRYVEAFRRSSFEAMLNYYKANYPREPYAEAKGDLPKVKCPVLLIHGLKDKYLLAAGLNDTWKWLEKDLTLVTVPEAGHFVQHEAAESVTRTMHRWLTR